MVGATTGLGPSTASADAPREEHPSPEQPDRSTEDVSPVVKVERTLRVAAAEIEAGEKKITLEFTDADDWVQTASGEWIRGDVDWMRNDIMEFDSDEFGPLEIHMRDVAAIHAARRDTFVFDDRTALYGRAFVTADHVIVETSEGIQVRPRETLWAIVQGGERELDHWSTMLDLGFSANRGNSNQIEFNLGWRITREDRRTLTELAYSLFMGRADGEQTVNRHLVMFLSKVWIDERFFVQPVVGQLLSDRFQDIRFRAQPAAAAGVRFLDRPMAWWNVSAGLGYQYLKLLDPLAGVRNPFHDGLARFATRARFDFTGDIYLSINWVTNLTFTTIGNTNHTGTAALLIEVINIFNLHASFLFLRTEEPVPFEDGTLPVKNDYQLIFGVALQLG